MQILNEANNVMYPAVRALTLIILLEEEKIVGCSNSNDIFLGMPSGVQDLFIEI